MNWNSATRQYEDANGNPVDPAQVREYVDEFITNAQKEIDDESGDLLSGAITIAAFFAFLSSLITSMHIASSLIAYGGEDEMNGTRWGRVDEKLSSELAYLEAFKEQVQESEVIIQSLAEFIANSSSAPNVKTTANVIAEAIQAEGRGDIIGTVEGALEVAGIETEIGADVLIDSFGERISDIIWGEVSSRSRSYPDATYATYENNVRNREQDAGAIGVRRVTEGDNHVCEGCEGAATEEYLSMDEIADIGIFECGGNDRCTFEFQYLGVDPLEIDRDIYT